MPDVYRYGVCVNGTQEEMKDKKNYMYSRKTQVYVNSL